MNLKTVSARRQSNGHWLVRERCQNTHRARAAAAPGTPPQILLSRARIGLGAISKHVAVLKLCKNAEFKTAMSVNNPGRPLVAAPVTLDSVRRQKTRKPAPPLTLANWHGLPAAPCLNPNCVSPVAMSFAATAAPGGTPPTPQGDSLICWASASQEGES
jgi:hypothetical protein